MPIAATKRLLARLCRSLDTQPASPRRRPLEGDFEALSTDDDPEWWLAMGHVRDSGIPATPIVVRDVPTER